MNRHKAGCRLLPFCRTAGPTLKHVARQGKRLVEVEDAYLYERKCQGVQIYSVSWVWSVSILRTLSTFLSLSKSVSDHPNLVARSTVSAYYAPVTCIETGQIRIDDIPGLIRRASDRPMDETFHTHALQHTTTHPRLVGRQAESRSAGRLAQAHTVRSGPVSRQRCRMQ